MKINRSTHFMILVLFAIAFVVIYLYYTIKDVKKIHLEISRLSNDVLQLTQSISNITNTLISQAAPAPSTSAAVCVAPFTVAHSAPQVHVTIPEETGSSSGDSVETAEMHKIIESIDEVEEVEAPITTNNADAEQQVGSLQTPFDANQLKSMSYDTVRKYCKDNGIDTKGSKDALVARILAKQGVA